MANDEAALADPTIAAVLLGLPAELALGPNLRVITLRRLLAVPKHELSFDGGLTWTSEDLSAGGSEEAWSSQAVEPVT